MSRTATRRRARTIRLEQRAGYILYRSPRGRKLIGKSNAAGFKGLRIKLHDVDKAVDESISAQNGSYRPSRDAKETMCPKLRACGGAMKILLKTVELKLFQRGWNFDYDDEFEAESHGKTVIDFKLSVNGQTR